MIYQLESGISKTKKILCHGNAKKDNAIDKSYYRTSSNVLCKTKTIVENEMIPQKIYDAINEQSVDVLTSVAQSNKLRDVKQVYRQAASVKKNETVKEESNEFTFLLKKQQEDKEFVRTISCLSESYYAFIADDTQLNEIVKFCRDENGVLFIGTRYNLCNG